LKVHCLDIMVKKKTQTQGGFVQDAKKERINVTLVGDRQLLGIAGRKEVTHRGGEIKTEKGKTINYGGIKKKTKRRKKLKQRGFEKRGVQGRTSEKKRNQTP